MTDNVHFLKIVVAREKKHLKSKEAAVTTLSLFTDNIEDVPYKRRCRLAFAALTKSILPRGLSDCRRSRECSTGGGKQNYKLYLRRQT